MQRNRKQGWAWAKMSGHVNENSVCELFNDKEYRKQFAEALSIPRIKSASVGGLCEESVNTVLGDKSRGKTDLRLLCEGGSHVNFSIKKSLSGQVFLITIDHFISGFEKQFNVSIPDDVKTAIQLFWGSHESVTDIIQSVGTSREYELKKHRLTACTLKAYDINLYDSLLNWFKDNIGMLADFCFSKGLVSDSSLWADYVWYINRVGENDVDHIIPVEEIISACEENKELICYGTRFNGTTIQLPFGFVQWHSPRKAIPGCIQFHHLYQLLIKILKNA